MLLSLLIASIAEGQVVDKVRLSYDSSRTGSLQSAMAASGDGKYLAFAYRDQTVQVFDVAANKFVSKSQSPVSKLFDLRLTYNGDRIVYVGDSRVVVYDWRAHRTDSTNRFPTRITRSTFNPILNILAMGFLDGTVTAFDIVSLNIKSSFKATQEQISVLDISPDGKSVVVGSVERFKKYPLQLYDIESKTLVGKSKNAIYTSAFFSESGNEIIVTGLKAKSPGGKIASGIASALGVVVLPYLIMPVETTVDGEQVDNKSTRIALSVVLGAGAAYGLYKAFKTKTFVQQLSRSDLSRVGKVSNKGKVAKVTYYLQGKSQDSLALMMTHTQSFDVFDVERSEKIFTTTENTPSFDASIDHLDTEQARIFKLGSRYLINTYRNNINQIYDPASNSIVGYMFTDLNGEFAVVSRDGRVDGSATALSKVFWTAKNSSKKTALESNFENGFSPRLLNEIISGSETATKDFDIDQVNATVPGLKVESIDGSALTNDIHTSDQKGIRVEVAAIENPNEVLEVRLFQNGKLVGSQPVSGDGRYVFNASLTNSFGEDNYFYVTAQSKSNFESAKEKFVVKYNSKAAETPTLYLLTVGINEYLNPRYNLNYARPDADGIEQSVKANSSSLIANIVTYSIRDSQASKQNLVAAFNEISSKAREQDVLWFYFAGHGVLLNEGAATGAFYLVPHDVTQLYGKDEALAEKAVSAAELKGMSQSIRAQKQIFILDACHSGSALEFAAARGGAEERAIAQLARSTGTFWITSTGSDQFASEFSKLGHGVFTYALLDGLNGNADANKDRRLTVRELTTYAEIRVPELSEQFKGVLQFPSCYSFGNDFPIALFK